MPSQPDDAQRSSRPRAGSTLVPFSWRKGRADAASAPAPGPSAMPVLSLEALIEALTPPAVPSLTHARALSSALAAKTPNPRLAVLTPVLVSLCNANSPPSFQAAGYDILAAYWENNGSTVLTTADRLSCLALFLDPATPWAQETWEPRFKALVAIIQSGAETVGMEGSLLRVLRNWIEGAFEGLISRESAIPEDIIERQRSVEILTDFLTSLVGKPEFVSRLSDQDTSEVLQLWEGMIDKALIVPAGYVSLASSPTSPVTEGPSSKPTSPQRIPLTHRHHHSSTSIPQMLSLKHPADIIVEAYLTYLATRWKALAPNHLKTILPLLFRALAFFATPLPRVSLNPSSPHQHAIEKRILDTLTTIVTGPFSSSCTNFLKHFMFPSSEISHSSIQTSVGALRTLRLSIRDVLINRLVRAYLTCQVSFTSTPAGVPTGINLEQKLMERAFKDEATSWDLLRFRSVLCRAVKAWCDQGEDVHLKVVGAPKEAVLNEIAAILKDVIQAFDERPEGEVVDDEEVSAVGDILQELASYVRPLRNRDGSTLALSLTQTNEASPFHSAISTLLVQDLMTTPLYPVLPSIILSIADHLPDSDTANLLVTMSERQSLAPTSPAWLEHWAAVLTIPNLYTSLRPLTRQVAMDILKSVWDFVRDIPVYRRPLAGLVFDIWKRQASGNMEDVTVTIIWHILGDEVVLLSAESQREEAAENIGDRRAADDVLDFLIRTASEKHEDDEETVTILAADAHVPSSQGLAQVSSVTTAVASPTVSRMQSEIQVAVKDQQSAMQSLTSLLTSFTSGNSPRSQSQPRQDHDHPPAVEPTLQHTEEILPMSKTVGAIVGITSIFSQLAFTPLVLAEKTQELALRVFRVLVDLLSSAGCVRARLAVLQFLTRLRVDRDHRLYFATSDYDKDGHIHSLASLINRAHNGNHAGEEPVVNHETRRARPRVPQERDGRRPSRGRGGPPSKLESSRSRSRTTPKLIPTSTSIRRAKARDPIWSLPETLPFSLADTDTPSEGITSFDPTCPDNRAVLPLSTYLTKLVDIIEGEKEWEILSYVLCHLPTQLANKHLFCGPKSKTIIGRLLSVICAGILEDKFATNIERWPDGIIARDAHGLAYHTLTVLISYKNCFPDVQLQHRLVEVLLLGLNGQPSTIKSCLHALSLSAFELQPSMTKFLSRILEKLSQIMSNPAMAVHIIEFLAIVGSLQSLHVNFTEGDYKMVFGVALQYLQYHNRPDESLPISWALSQHVRVMSYYIIYLWFLAVKFPDRPRHIKFITRQLLLANEGQNEVDEPTEVCFDWLARYTYASADPRPANSMLSDIVTSRSLQKSTPEPVINEKTWIAGNAVITVRALARRGWMEVLSRRASGLTKFLCRAENVPMVPVGDVDPDTPTIFASLTMDRDAQNPGTFATESVTVSEGSSIVQDLQLILSPTAESKDNTPRPDPITGYVWSGTAPSQRRKEVSIDPGYLSLQLSSYPDHTSGRPCLVTDSSRLSRFCSSLDRMPVIDTHKVGIMYVAPGQKHENEILRNDHGSPAYTRFLEGLARLINLRGQVDVYAGGLDPNEDGEYAYAWWDDIGQILFHTATLMPASDDEICTNKKRHIGNDFVRIVWNDSGMPYAFDTLTTQFQFVNIVIEPHSRGAIAAFSDNIHENEYFKVIVQRAPGMTEFTPIGDFKLISAETLPLLVRQLSLLTDWFVSVFQHTQNDTARVEMVTNWRSRLQAIKRFRALVASDKPDFTEEGVMGQEYRRDFTTAY
ncbi:hypothetical protein AcW1_002178 [Taiwanofungus camphoratus]|nr:hypothetical protein AcW1_002178 [Antrodia cinnamomea]KAI0946137.1 hypothetical protein AcV7_010188 [Antrodia cinnamomea]